MYTEIFYTLISISAMVLLLTYHNFKKCPKCGKLVYSASSTLFGHDRTTQMGKLRRESNCKKCGHKWTEYDTVDLSN